jgi:hypothetical protein
MMRAYRDPRCMGTACTATDDSFWPTASVTSIRLARKVSRDKLPDSSGSAHLSDIKGLEMFRGAVGKFVMGIGGRAAEAKPARAL